MSVPLPTDTAQRALVLGATGTAGRATVQALLEAGHNVTCCARSDAAGLPDGVDVRQVDVTDPAAFVQKGLRGEHYDALISCLASRTGAARDAWAVDYQVHSDVLKAAQAAGIGHMVLLSAICVQKPELPFQQAKLAFEAELVASGLTYSIVRPTAFFKSLSGQIARIQAGKPFLTFGDGQLTRCKPISDRDLGRFIAGCLTDPSRQNRILPIGGPGPAISPQDQVAILSDLLGRPVPVKHVPVVVMDMIVGGLTLLGKLHGTSAARAELAKIGRYYATESMLVWDADAGCYDAAATPETGQDTLRDHYAALLAGTETVDLGAHAVF